MMAQTTPARKTRYSASRSPIYIYIYISELWLEDAACPCRSYIDYVASYPVAFVEYILFFNTAGSQGDMATKTSNYKQKLNKRKKSPH